MLTVALSTHAPHAWRGVLTVALFSHAPHAWLAHHRSRHLAGDAAPSTPIHQLTLTYDFEVPKGDGDDKALKVQPIVQGLHSQLYDSPLDSQVLLPSAPPLPHIIAHAVYSR